MFTEDENEVMKHSSLLHNEADVSKEYFYELSKEFGGLGGEEEDTVVMYAPLRKGSKNKPSRHLINQVRSNPEIESFFRFVAENDLRHEALAILEEYLKEKGAKRRGSKEAPVQTEEALMAELNSKQKAASAASAKQEADEVAEELAMAEEDVDEAAPKKAKTKVTKSVTAKKAAPIKAKPAQKVAKKKPAPKPKKAIKMKAKPKKAAKPAKKKNGLAKLKAAFSKKKKKKKR